MTQDFESNLTILAQISVSVRNLEFERNSVNFFMFHLEPHHRHRSLCHSGLESLSFGDSENLK